MFNHKIKIKVILKYPRSTAASEFLLNRGIIQTIRQNLYRFKCIVVYTYNYLNHHFMHTHTLTHTINSGMIVIIKIKYKASVAGCSHPLIPNCRHRRTFNFNFIPFLSPLTCHYPPLSLPRPGAIKLLPWIVHAMGENPLGLVWERNLAPTRHEGKNRRRHVKRANEVVTARCDRRRSSNHIHYY